MMLGLLLARAGLRVAVLEKHRDFLRDFRGDTIHPSTLEVLHELGLLEEFLRLPHQKVQELQGQVGETMVTIADFRHLPVRCPYIALIPQWDFLDFLARHGARYPGFQLKMETEVDGLLMRDGRVAGVKAGGREIEADLVIGADGRGSTVRAAAGLEVKDLGAPIDVLWFRLSRRPQDPGDTMGRFDRGSILVMLNRGEHWQCAFVIPKDSAQKVRDRGLDAFRARIASLVPVAGDRLGEIASWDGVKLLTVQVNRLRRWYREGLLCIGDAAHAMSPVGGIGINLAIQDAVAAANLLRDGDFGLRNLEAVQSRRELPTRLTQGFQVLVQNLILKRVLAEDADAGRAPLRPPLFLRMLTGLELFRRIPARVVGMGFRPEHVRI